MKHSFGKVFLGLKVLIVIAVAAYYLLRRQTELSGTSAPSSGSMGMPNIRFYGLVIDETGSPVSNAEVHVSIWKVPPGWSSREGPPLRDVTEQMPIHTGKAGEFTLLGEKGYIVQISDVRKSGHEWVVDLDWSWPIPDKVHPDNRYFIYGGGFPIYVPDEDRPAIFPLHRKGSQVIGSPSRGGSDQLVDGQVVPNEPIKPLLPSTGPTTPKTAIERAKKLRQLHMSASTTQATTTQPWSGPKLD